MIKDADITCIFGRRGSGKSTLAKRETAGVDRLIVFDPLKEYAKDGYAACHGLDEVQERFLSGRFSPIRLAYVPPADGDHVEALSNLSKLLWLVQSPYQDDPAVPELTLLVEEIQLSYPSIIPRHYGGFTKVVLQGRHVGINIVGITQRPALVSPNFRGNASTIYIFPLMFDQDRAEMLKLIGRDHTETLRTMENHTYLRVVNGEVDSGSNPTI